ncbi:MAG: SDR family oxidoreductase [Ottowia sp.]|nr:SDR family oxidoreductase [Ottowia sp.]
MNTTPRTALVTGAGRRIGRVIALALARAGWQVAVHYHHSRTGAAEVTRECAALAGRSAAFDANLADEAAVRALLPQVAAHFGSVDAVISSAALFDYDDAAAFGHAALDAHMHVNAAAPVLLAQALADHVRARNATGCAVHLLDQKLWNPNPDFLSYTLSKAALRSATTLLAQALAPAVRVVGVAPGLTLDSPWMADEADFQRLHAQSPLGRSSTPDDVAAAVLFALDNPAITGATLLVDGGQHLMRFERDFSMMAAGAAAPAAPPAPAQATSEQRGQRRIIVSGLRFDASLGILRRERRAAQPIVVDAELNMGAQPLRPAHDAIGEVLDYRRVREIIIEECTAEHVNLLESMIGRLAERLLTLPGVIGVRVKISKPEIFPDCEVAMQALAGQW